GEKMRIDKQKRMIYFDYHELAFSKRTMENFNYFVNRDGEIIDYFRSQKNAFRVPILPDAEYLFAGYYSYRGNPKHRLIRLSDGLVVARVDYRGVTVYEELPEKIREFLEKQYYT
ncbi:MAG: hypothetical protein ACQXXG_09655, partial [Candidatus Bathyarchaeia archaeon]